MNLAAFDLEGIIVKEEFLVELGRAVGKEKEIEKITRLGLEGKINWEEGLRKRIELLIGIDEKTLIKTAENFTLKYGTLKALTALKENNFEIAIITGGFGILAKNLCQKLGINLLVCNELVFENKKLAGVKMNVNGNKDEWLRFFADKTGAKITLAFGDGANDIAMTEAATYGKILKPEENILEEVQKAINIFKPLAEIGVR